MDVATGPGTAFDPTDSEGYVRQHVKDVGGFALTTNYTRDADGNPVAISWRFRTAGGAPVRSGPVATAVPAGGSAQQYALNQVNAAREVTGRIGEDCDFGEIPNHRQSVACERVPDTATSRIVQDAK